MYNSSYWRTVLSEIEFLARRAHDLLCPIADLQSGRPASRRRSAAASSCDEAGRYEKAGDDRPRPSHRRRQRRVATTGDARGHRLQNRVAQAFGPRRQHEDVERGEDRVDVLAVSEQANLVVEAQSGRTSSDVGTKRTVAGNRHHRPQPVATEQGRRIHEDDVILYRDQASHRADDRGLGREVERSAGFHPAHVSSEPREVDTVSNRLNPGSGKSDLARHPLGQAGGDGQHAIDTRPGVPLTEALPSAQLERPVFAVHNDRHAGEPRGHQTLEQCAPGVGMYDVRALATKQPVQIPHQTGIVALAPRCNSKKAT